MGKHHKRWKMFSKAYKESGNTLNVGTEIFTVKNLIEVLKLLPRDLEIIHVSHESQNYFYSIPYISIDCQERVLISAHLLDDYFKIKDKLLERG